jgi:hypothetical protein
MIQRETPSERLKDPLKPRHQDGFRAEIGINLSRLFRAKSARLDKLNRSPGVLS